MNLNELQDILNESDEPIDESTLDLEEIKTNIPQFSNEKLCEMIVCDRYFGLEERIAPICMEELAKRRMSGDTFNFESHIDQVQKELPVIDFTMPDLRTILNQAVGGKFKI